MRNIFRLICIFSIASGLLLSCGKESDNPKESYNLDNIIGTWSKEKSQGENPNSTSTWKFGSDNILRVQIYYTGTERGFTYEFSYEVFPEKKTLRISMPWDDGITTYGDYSINECTSKKMRLVLTSSYETEEKEGYFYKEVLLNKIK